MSETVDVPEDALDTVMEYVHDDPGLDAVDPEGRGSSIVDAIIAVNRARGVEWSEHDYWQGECDDE